MDAPIWHLEVKPLLLCSSPVFLDIWVFPLFQWWRISSWQNLTSHLLSSVWPGASSLSQSCCVYLGTPWKHWKFVLMYASRAHSHSGYPHKTTLHSYINNDLTMQSISDTNPRFRCLYREGASELTSWTLWTLPCGSDVLCLHNTSVLAFSAPSQHMASVPLAPINHRIRNSFILW